MAVRRMPKAGPARRTPGNKKPPVLDRRELSLRDNLQQPAAAIHLAHGHHPRPGAGK